MRRSPARYANRFVYYTYTEQTLKVVEAMASVFRGRGCDVQMAAIEFTTLATPAGSKSSPCRTRSASWLG